MTTADYYFSGSPIEPREYRPFALSQRRALVAALMLGLTLVFASSVRAEAADTQTTEEQPFQP